MSQETNPLAKAAQEIEDLANSARAMAEQSPDVKEGRISVEDELKEPAYVLYDQITKCTANIFRQPGIAGTFKHLSTIIGEEATADVMNIVAVCMTHSAHQAVLFYDDLLKDELKKQLDRIIEQTNKNGADLVAHGSAIKVFRKAINDINEKLLIDKIKDPTQ